MYTFKRLAVDPTQHDVGRKCDLKREDDAVAGHWPGAERFKLQAHDALAADRFGSAVSYLVSQNHRFMKWNYLCCCMKWNYRCHAETWSRNRRQVLDKLSLALNHQGTIYGAIVTSSW